MKNKFIYPTKKNMLIIWFLLQILVGLLFILNSFSWLKLLSLQFVVLGIICVWEYKPVQEFDERELALELKWKNRMFEATAYCMAFPLMALALNPALEGWKVFSSFAVPMFSTMVVLSALMKLELGSFFYPTE